MTHKKLLSISLFFIFFAYGNDKTDIYICTAANYIYFPHLLNFIGSLHKVNFDSLKEIAVFNLGLTDDQIKELHKIEKLSVHEVEKVHPDILKEFMVLPNGKTAPGWYAWKPVAIKQALDMFPYVLWIDAGSTFLKPIDPLLEYIKKNGYFLATIGQDRQENGRFPNDIEWQLTQHVRKQFDLDTPEKNGILANEAIMATIVGVSKDSAGKFLLPWYQLAHDLKNFEDDGSAPNGFGTARWDQALLGVLGYLNKLKVFKQDYTQIEPMKFDINGRIEDFYITWHTYFVNDKTNIYSSRWDLSRLDYFKDFIRYKAN